MSTPGFTRSGPSSTNTLKETAFSFSAAYIPDTIFHLQSVNVPSLTGTPINVGTPLSPVYVPGDSMEFDPLTLSFLVDENLANYRKMSEWMTKLYTAKDTDDLLTLKSETFIQDNLGGGVCDASLTIRSNKQNPTARIHFRDLFPTSLGELQLTSVSDDAQNLVCTATFHYNTYDIEYPIS